MKKIPGNFARTHGNILAKAKGHIPTPRTDGVISLNPTDTFRMDVSPVRLTRQIPSQHKNET